MAVEPYAVSGSMVPILQNIVYFSNDIDDQFYLHSQTGYVMVDAGKLKEGNYTFTAYANYTAMGGVMESLSVTIVVRVLPEFYFAGTEDDGSYLAYVSTEAPVGTYVMDIMPQYTLLYGTTFNCSLDRDEAGDNLAVSLYSDTLVVTGTSSSGVRQFVVVCLASEPSSSVVIETLRVLITIVFYQFSGIYDIYLTTSSKFLWCFLNLYICRSRSLKFDL